MKTPTTTLTPADRVTWAKEQSGKTWQQLAEATGCAHSALVQWSRGQTDVLNVKAQHLFAYADATGVYPEWILFGQGPALRKYAQREHQLVQEARHIAAERPSLAEGAYRMLLTLEQITPTT